MKLRSADSHLSTLWALRPVLAPILRRPGLSLVLGMAGATQVAATLAHLPAMACPVMELFHVPCPGCGLSRACAAVIRGDWHQAIRLHAFAPFLLAAIALFWVAACLPSQARLRLAAYVERMERQTGLPTLLLIMLVLYWIVRLLYAPDAFRSLVAT
ncbi:MAG TPA: DUF2752 domain-containing protein [Tepidisphaeraceae bacterium]|jgi:hypothetical protein|nr:DUF2752 domain-containing protein [Tepidisphaeraceae bacterium]